MAILLDTNVYLYAMQSEDGAALFERQFFPLVFQTYLAAVVVEELYAGALDIQAIRLVERYVGALDQVLRSGTSVGAHFREAQRAKSNLDFISKIEGGMQELEETAYWLELLEGSRLCQANQLASLRSEADQLMAIFVTIVRKTKSRMAKLKF